MSKTFIILMAPEYGGLNGTLTLSKALKRRGHHVIYVGPPLFEQYILDQGLDYHTIKAPDVGESGTFLEQIVRRGQELMRVNQELEEWLRQIKPDLFVIDPPLWFLAAPALTCGIPIVALKPTFISAFTLAVPPTTSLWIPRHHRSVPSTMMSLLLWLKPLATTWVGMNSAMLAMRVCCGWEPASYIRQRGGKLMIGDFGYSLDVPELIIGPRSLDFPTAQPSANGTHYLGLCVDESREDGDFDWTAFDPSKPIAYCALGTLHDESPHIMKFFVAVVEAFRQLPSWQLILRVGKSFNIDRLGPLPSSIHVVKTVPQLKVLQRVQLLLNHGASGSLREAIYYGVPSILFPLGGGDQRGFSSRILFHNLGRRGDIHRVDAKKIISLVEEVTTSREIAASVKKFKESCRQSMQHDLDGGIELLERYARAPG